MQQSAGKRLEPDVELQMNKGLKDESLRKA